MSIVLVALACGGSSATSDLTLAGATPRNVQSATLVDLQALREDGTLSVVAESIGSSLDAGLAGLGLRGSELTGAITFVIGGERALVVQGDIVEEELRQRLADSGFLAQKVGDREVWSGTGPVGGVALLRGGRVAVSGDAREMSAIVEALSEGRNLGSDEEMAVILAELPEGVVVSVSRDCFSVAAGCRAIGISFDKMDSLLAGFTFVALFDSESEVESAREDLEAFVRLERLYSGVTTRIVGRHFVAEGEARSAEIFGGLSEEFDLSD
ncbi:MAG: hypothetical protein V3U26_03175 [Dehalococcoidia bacterium]